MHLVIGVEGSSWQRLSVDDFKKAMGAQSLPYCNTRVQYSLGWHSDSWENDLKPFFNEVRRPVVILLSDEFATWETGKLSPTPVAHSIRALCKSKQAYCGLIALTDRTGSRPAEIDGLLPASELTASGLKESLTSVSAALWFKAPPAPVPNSEVIRERVQVECVQKLSQFHECLKLRHSVYRLLGYLKEDVETAKTEIEMDGYDEDAIHLIATDQETGRIVGCARLILPSRWGAIPELAMGRERKAQIAEVPCDVWCRNFANDEPSPVFRKFLEYRAQSAMPGALLKSVIKLRSELRFSTGEFCELSRLIVAPDYRGLGISKALVAKASALAAALGRKCLILECATHHQTYYEGLGFKTVHDECIGEMAQTLNQVALPMYRMLPPPPASPAPAPSPSACRLTPPVRQSSLSQFPYNLRLTLSEPNLDGKQIEDLTQQMFTNLRSGMRAEIETPQTAVGVKGGAAAVLIETREALPVLNAILPLFEGHQELALSISNHGGARHLINSDAWRKDRVHTIAGDLQRFIEQTV